MEGSQSKLRGCPTAWVPTNDQLNTQAPALKEYRRRSPWTSATQRSPLGSKVTAHGVMLVANFPPTGVPFATDGGPLAALGVETLVFGPGSIDVAHRADEFVPFADLVRTVDVVRDLVLRRCLVPRDAAPAAR